MKRKYQYLLMRIICSAVFLTVGLPAAYAASAKVTMLQGGKVSIKANGTPLRDVLMAMEEKGGVVLKTSPQLDDPVSCDLVEMSVEEAIKQLLFTGYNYALVQGKTVTAGRPEEYFLWIYEKKTDRQKMTMPVAATPPSTGGAVLKTLSWGDLRKKFANKKIVAQQLVVQRPTELPPDGPGGVLVTDIQPNSPLEDLGIAKGDLISGVNGSPVRSAEDFARLMTPAAVGERTLIMIERTRQDKPVGPIYINLKN